MNIYSRPYVASVKCTTYRHLSMAHPSNDLLAMPRDIRQYFHLSMYVVLIQSLARGCRIKWLGGALFRPPYSKIEKSEADYSCKIWNDEDRDKRKYRFSRGICSICWRFKKVCTDCSIGLPLSSVAQLSNYIKIVLLLSVTPVVKSAGCPKSATKNFIRSPKNVGKPPSILAVWWSNNENKNKSNSKKALSRHRPHWQTTEI